MECSVYAILLVVFITQENEAIFCLLIEFPDSYHHNLSVMHKNDEDLLKWARQHEGLLNVTLGQLAKLLELSESQSVAFMSRKSKSRDAVSQAVGDRQKLRRLAEGLALGRDLTRLDGKKTRVTEVGLQLANEVRHLLSEIKYLAEGRPAHAWHIAAGDSWLQCGVLPALDRMSQTDRQSRWVTHNLDVEPMRSGLLKGELHFGLMRKDKAEEQRGLEPIGQIISVKGYTLLIDPKDGPSLPASVKDKIRWLVKNDRKLIQHDSSWLKIVAALQSQQKDKMLLKDVVPHVACGTHVQAAIAVAGTGESWAIVPTLVAKRFARKEAHGQQLTIDDATLSDELVLVICPRVIEQLPKWQKVKDQLRQEIGRALAY
jgi:DNA-binding transcriptional LysR family regulator